MFRSCQQTWTIFVDKVCQAVFCADPMRKPRFTPLSLSLTLSRTHTCYKLLCVGSLLRLVHFVTSRRQERTHRSAGIARAMQFLQAHVKVLLVASAILSSGTMAQSNSSTTSSNSTDTVAFSAEVTGMNATVSANITAAPTPATLAPVASAAPDSTTFQLVPNEVCSDEVVDVVNTIYTKNRGMFEECVDDADYQIYPHSGEHPTAEQVYAMTTSPSCIAIFTAVVLSSVPACDLGGMPLKSVTETLLKIKVDVDEGRASPSAERFQELMKWRRDVDLAQAAGVPYDSESTLYQEFKTNLWKALSNSTVKVGTDLTLEYQLPNGTYTRGELSFSTLDDGSSTSPDDVVGRVQAASSTDGVQTAEPSSSGSRDTVSANVMSSAPASRWEKSSRMNAVLVSVAGSLLVAATLA